MNKIALLLFICLIIFVGCTNYKDNDTNDNVNENENKINVPIDTNDNNKDRENNDNNIDNEILEGEITDMINEKLKNMSTKEKIGQLSIVGFDGLTPSPEIINFINEYKVGGVILFKKNIANKEQVKTLIDELNKINIDSDNTIPIFLGVDQEGGRVNRLPAEMGTFEAAKSIGDRNDTSYAREFGKRTAIALKDVGFNLNFAPSLDINSNPNNPVIGDRAYGDNPQIVESMGIEVYKGLKDENVISAVKHFPGHGDTSVDSHSGLPVVNNTLERLKSFEFLPFNAAIKEGVSIIMTAHILLPKIDEDYPATLSYKILTEILRNDLNYSGVIITDDMTMGAISQNYSPDKSAVMAIGAGADIVMFCHEPEIQKKLWMD